MLLDGADFDHRAAGSEIAEQDRQRAPRRVWLGDRPNTLVVEVADVLDIFPNRFSGDGERIEKKRSRLSRQLLEQRWDAAGGVDILDMPLPVPIPRRRYFRQMRHTLGDIIKPREGIFDSRFVGDGDDVKQSVGGTAHRDVQRYGVVDRIRRDDIPEADAAAQQLQHLTRRCAREVVSLG